MHNILLLSTARTWRGGEQQLYFLQKYLRNTEHQIHLGLPKKSALLDFIVAEENPAPVKLFELPKKISTGVFSAWKLAKYCRQNKIDIIHCHDARAHTIAYLASIIYANSVPIVVSRRVAFPVKNNRKSLKKYQHPSIKKYIGVSHVVCDVLCQTIDKRYCQLVYDGIDLSCYNANKSGRLHKELGINPSQKIIICVAAMTGDKDHFTLLKAIKALRLMGAKNFQVVLVGSGKLEDQIKARCQLYGLNDQVIFLGQRSDVPALLADSDIFLLSSKTEGLCQSILEAMAAGLPVVCTRAGGVPEIVTHQQTGISVAVGDFQALAEGVCALLNDETLCQRFKNNGLQHVKQFTADKMAQQTQLVYDHVLNS